MDDPKAKQQIITPDGQAKFKFLRFSEKLERVDIDVTQKTHLVSLEPVKGTGSFFNERLQDLKTINYTKEYRDLYYSLSGLVPTLSHILLHKPKIVSILIKKLSKDSRNSLKENLSLIECLARDLGSDLYSEFNRLYRAIFQQLDKQSTQNMEAIFSTLMLLFKHMSEPLLKNWNKLYRKALPYLGDRKPFIREYMSKCLRFLLRKLKGDQLTNAIKFIFEVSVSKRSLELNTGLSFLFSSAVKGVKRQLHSCHSRLLPIVIQSLRYQFLPRVLEKCISKENFLDIETRFKIVRSSFRIIIRHVTPKEAEKIIKFFWDEVDYILNSQISNMKKLKVTKDNFLKHLNSLLFIINDWFDFRTGFLINDLSGIFELLTKLFSPTKNLLDLSTNLEKMDEENEEEDEKEKEKDSSINMISESSLDLLVTLIKVYEKRDEVEKHHTELNQIFKLLFTNGDTEQVTRFIRGICNWEHYSEYILPFVVEFCATRLNKNDKWELVYFLYEIASEKPEVLSSKNKKEIWDQLLKDLLGLLKDNFIIIKKEINDDQKKAKLIEIEKAKQKEQEQEQEQEQENENGNENEKENEQEIEIEEEDEEVMIEKFKKKKYGKYFNLESKIWVLIKLLKLIEIESRNVITILLNINLQLINFFLKTIKNLDDLEEEESQIKNNRLIIIGECLYLFSKNYQKMKNYFSKKKKKNFYKQVIQHLLMDHSDLPEILAATDHFLEWNLTSKDIDKETIFSIINTLSKGLLSNSNKLRVSILKNMVTFEKILMELDQMNYKSTVFQTCLEVEEIPNNIQEERKKILRLNNIINDLEYKRIPKYILPIICRYTIGLYHVRFSILWPVAIELIENLVKIDFKIFWEVAIQQVNKSLEQKIIDQQLRQEKRIEERLLNKENTKFKNRKNKNKSQFDKNNYFYKERLLYSSLNLFERLYHKAIQRDKNFIDYQNYFRLLIKSLEQKNFLEKIQNSHNKELVEIFLQIIHSREYNNKNKKKIVQQKMKFLLDFFSKFTSLQNLHKKEEIQYILINLLKHSDSKIQLGALKCLSLFPSNKVIKYYNVLENFIKPEAYKDQILKFNINYNFDQTKTKNTRRIDDDIKIKNKSKSNNDDDDDGDNDNNLHKQYSYTFLLKEDRKEILPLIVRVLYPKLFSGKGKHLKKNDISTRRSSILSYFIGLDKTEIGILIDLLTKPFQRIESYDQLDDYLNSRIMVNSSTEKGFLLMLEHLIKYLGKLLSKSMPRILMLICFILKKGINEQDQEVRSYCIKRICQIIERFPNFDFHTHFFPNFFEISKQLFENIKNGSQELQNSLIFLLTLTRSEKLSKVLFIKDFLINNLISCFTSEYSTKVVIKCCLEIFNRIVSYAGYDEEIAVFFKQCNIYDKFLNSLIIVMKRDNNRTLIQGLTESKNFKQKNKFRKKHSSFSVIAQKELFLLYKLSNYIENAGQAKIFIELISPFFDFKIKSSIKIRNQMISIFYNMLKLIENPIKYLNLISTFFYLLRTKNERDQCLEMFKTFSKKLDALNLKINFLNHYKILNLMNSFKKKSVKKEINIDHRIKGYTTLQDYINNNMESFENYLQNEEKNLKKSNDMKTENNKDIDIEDNDHNNNNNNNNNNDDDEDDDEKYLKNLQIEQLKPFIYTIIYDFFFIHDNTVKELAYNTLQLIIKVSTQEYIKILKGFINRGITSNNVGIKKFSIQLLQSFGYVKFDDQYLYPELNKILKYEKNFFKNISDINLKNRLDSIKKFKYIYIKYFESNLNINLYIKIFTGLLSLRPSKNDKTNKYQAIVKETIKTLGKLSVKMSWKDYFEYLSNFIWQIKKNKERLDLRNHYIQIVTIILENFHFNLHDKNNNNNNSKKRIENENENENASKNKLMKYNEKIDQGEILYSFENRILPIIFDLLTEGQTFEIVFSQISVCVVKILLFFPKHKLNEQLSKIITILAAGLVKKNQNHRDSYRKSLNDLIKLLGADYFLFFVGELQSNLKEGYQVHVLGYTINSLLNALIGKYLYDKKHLIEGNNEMEMEKKEEEKEGKSEDKSEGKENIEEINEDEKEKDTKTEIEMGMEIEKQEKKNKNKIKVLIKNGELDYCIPLLMKVFINDMFGEVAKERRISKITNSMKETKYCTSYHSLELICSVINFENTILNIIEPLHGVLNKHPNIKTTNKLIRAFKSISSGLLINNSMKIEDLCTFCYNKLNEYYIIEFPYKYRNNTDNDNDDDDKMGKNKNKNGGEDDDIEANLTKEIRKEMKKDILIDMEPRKKRMIEKKKEYYLQNVHIISEFSLQLLNKFLKNKIVIDLEDDESLQMIDPFIKLLIQGLKSKYDQLKINCLKTLITLTRYSKNIPSFLTELEYIQRNILGIIVKNSGTRGSLGQYSLKLFVKIILTFKQINLDNTQLNILLNFAKTDLDDPEHINSTFNLLDSILTLKKISPILYDIIDKIFELLVKNNLDNIKQRCLKFLSKFLNNFPIGKNRLKYHLHFLIQNLNYPMEFGRESILELMGLLIESWPIERLDTFTEFLFVPLVLQMVNDQSTVVRKMCAIIIKQIIERVDFNRRKNLMTILMNWFQNSNKILVRRTAAQTVGLFIEQLSKKNFHIFLDSCWKELTQCLYGLMKRKKNLANNNKRRRKNNFKDNETKKHEWELLYYLLNTIEKILKEFPIIFESDLIDNKEKRRKERQERKKKKKKIQEKKKNKKKNKEEEEEEEEEEGEEEKEESEVNKKQYNYQIGRLLQTIQKLLLYEHHWVRLQVDRLFGTYFAYVKKNLDQNKVVKSNYLNQNENTIYNLFKNFCSQLMNKTVEDKITEQITKNILFLIIYEKSHNNDTSINWVIKRLSFLSRNADISIQRPIFQLFALLIKNFFDNNEIEQHLSSIIIPIFRTINRLSRDRKHKKFYQKNLIQEHVQFCRQILDILKESVGTISYLKTFEEIKANFFNKKKYKKSQMAIEAVVNPEKTKLRNYKKMVKQREKKKRRIDMFRNDRGSLPIMASKDKSKQIKSFKKLK
ncbi:hypothetical protein M0812_09304 [Anaeramoeba flamelloides]|uniref:Small subunit processome component 20 homolog n=1 Tax=Anaeramoeba flamelloides TaxID=1746091 RepID=A0AAV7ZSV4_9EUKA|nr:hypothetical protein M0812_09304 [Anaeramoeba flamelloides]